MTLTIHDVVQLIPGDLVSEFTKTIRAMREPEIDSNRRIVFKAHEVRGFLDFVRQNHYATIHELRLETGRLASVIEDLSAVKH